MQPVEKKKTILYIVTKANWGGAQRYVYDLALSATTRGYAPIVAAGGEGMLTEQLLAHNIATKRIYSLERDVHIFKEFHSFFEIVRIIRAIKPSIVHVNSSKAGGIGACAARLCGTACIIFTVHGLPQNEDRSWLSKKLIAFLTWLTALLAHRVIAVASADANVLRQQPFLRKKIRHIPNGIDFVGKNRADAREIIQSHVSDTAARELLAHPVWIGTVAELTRNKGHQYAFEAIIALREQYPDIAYIVIGEGELAEKCKAFVHEHDLQNHVFFTGFIPHAAELYSAFDIYLAPSIKEGLPYTIIEAMMSGVAVVATQVGGIPDIISNEVSGLLVAPHSSSAIKDAVTRLLEDDTYRASLGKNAREEALKTYTKSSMDEQTFALYNTCAHPTDTARA